MALTGALVSKVVMGQKVQERSMASPYIVFELATNKLATKEMSLLLWTLLQMSLLKREFVSNELA